MCLCVCVCAYLGPEVTHQKGRSWLVVAPPSESLAAAAGPEGCLGALYDWGREQGERVRERERESERERERVRERGSGRRRGGEEEQEGM